MEFRKYQHIERFGTPEVQGIEVGMCYIFPKLDGTNSQLWWDMGLQAGSRNRHLSLESDNAGFYAWALQQQNIITFLDFNRELKLFGEWLVPHTLKTYTKDAWRKFYVFDVLDLSDGTYLSYEKYKPMLQEWQIDYIPPICKVQNPTYEKLTSYLTTNTFLVEDGKGAGEGIVIKNYNYRNPFGRVVWAKIVANEFKATKQRGVTQEERQKRLTEEAIVEKYVTRTLVEKELAKIDINGWTGRDIPKLLNTVYYCLIKEESWNFVKELKNPTINYKTLFSLTVAKVKELIPDRF